MSIEKTNNLIYDDPSIKLKNILMKYGVTI